MSAIPNLPESVTNGAPGSNADAAFRQAMSTKDGTSHVEDVHANGGTNGTSHIPWQLHDQPVENQRPLKVIVIGAGYSGIYLGIRLPERLRNVEVVIYEKNAGVGGTW